MGFNPADYAAVQAKAKAMSKQELEDVYTDDRNRRHLSPGDIVSFIVLGALLIFVIGFAGWAIASTNYYADIQEISTQVESEVCPLVSDAYIYVDFKHTQYNDLEIDCLDYRVR